MGGRRILPVNRRRQLYLAPIIVVKMTEEMGRHSLTKQLKPTFNSQSLKFAFLEWSQSKSDCKIAASQNHLQVSPSKNNNMLSNATGCPKFALGVFQHAESKFAIRFAL